MTVLNVSGEAVAPRKNGWQKQARVPVVVANLLDERADRQYDVRHDRACSDLPTCRYDATMLSAVCRSSFPLVHHDREKHRTPQGSYGPSPGGLCNARDITYRIATRHVGPGIVTVPAVLLGPSRAQRVTRGSPVFSAAAVRAIRVSV